MDPSDLAEPITPAPAATTSLRLFAVYDSPLDFPGMYVARMFNLDQPTAYYIAAQRLDVLRSLLPRGLTRLLPSEQDDPCIVEIWL